MRNEFAHRFGKTFFSYGVVKSFTHCARCQGLRTNLPILPVLWGGYYWFTQRKVIAFFVPLILLVLSNILPVIFVGPTVGPEILPALARLVQFFCLIGLAHFMAKDFSEKDFNFILGTWEVLTILLLIVEKLYGGPIASRYLGFIMRYRLLTGEPNYSSLLLSLVFMLRIYQGKYLRSLISLLPVIIASSRASYVTVLMFGFLLAAYRKLPKGFYYKLCLGIMMLYFLYPFLLVLFDMFISDETRHFMVDKMGVRYFHHCAYVKMAFEHIWGVGYFNGVAFCRPYIDQYMNFFGKYNPEYNQQHGMFIQLISEFGFVGYGLFCYFVYKGLTMLRDKLPEMLHIYVALFASFSMLNSFNELTFYFMFALMWAMCNREGFNFKSVKLAEKPLSV